MSSMDLYEDGFPHSTKQGYQQGCRGNACPGKLEHGFSCAEAHTRYQGDYGYRKKVDAGLSPQLIAAEEQLPPAPVVKPRRPRVDRNTSRLHMEATVTVADSVEPVRPEPAPVEAVRPVEPVSVPVPVVEPAKVSVAPAVFPHGTARGYGKGCHKDEDCPSMPSCRQAHREYQHDYWERRRKAGGLLGQAKGRREVTETGDVAPVKSATTLTRDLMVEVLEGLKGELVASKRRVEVLEAELAAVRAEWAPAGPGRHRADV